MREFIQVDMSYRALANWCCLDSKRSEDKCDPHCLISRTRQSQGDSASC